MPSTASSSSPWTELKAACLPFVTRSLRGARRRRTWATAALVTLATIVLGLWMAQSASPAARETRQGLGFEAPLALTELQTLTVHGDSADTRDDLEDAIERLDDAQAQVQYRVEHLAATACSAADWAARGEGRAATFDPQLRRAAARALQTPHCGWLERTMVPAEAQDPAWVQRAIDQQLRPRVERYASPLGLLATLVLLGGLGGALVTGLMLLLAPLLVGLQMAQEVHDNTLQPLTGTALDARHIAIGLPAGPLAVVGIVALGPAALLAIGAIAAGHPFALVGFAATLAVTTAFVVLVAQLAALAIGRQRSPGIIMILLGAALTGILCTAAALGLESTIHAPLAGFVATWPGAGAAYLYQSIFFVGDVSTELAIRIELSLAAATVGTAILAAVVLLVTERRIVADPEGLLSRAEAAVAGVVLSAMAWIALPEDIHEFADTYFVSLLMLIGPLQLLLMARLPGGDRPPSMRTIPLGRLLGEYAVALGLHLAFILVVAPPDFGDFSVGAVFHWGWAVTVLALVTVRGTALPCGALAKLWLAVVLLFSALQLGLAAALAASGGRGPFFIVGELPAPVGFLYLGLVVGAPWSLLAAVSKSGAKVT